MSIAERLVQDLLATDSPLRYELHGCVQLDDEAEAAAAYPRVLKTHGYGGLTSKDMLENFTVRDPKRPLPLERPATQPTTRPFSVAGKHAHYSITWCDDDDALPAQAPDEFWVEQTGDITVGNKTLKPSIEEDVSGEIWVICCDPEAGIEYTLLFYARYDADGDPKTFDVAGFLASTRNAEPCARFTGTALQHVTKSSRGEVDPGVLVFFVILTVVTGVVGGGVYLWRQKKARERLRLVVDNAKNKMQASVLEKYKDKIKDPMWNELGSEIVDKIKRATDDIAPLIEGESTPLVDFSQEYHRDTPREYHEWIANDIRSAIKEWEEKHRSELGLQDIVDKDLKRSLLDNKIFNAEQLISSKDVIDMMQKTLFDAVLGPESNNMNYIEEVKREHWLTYQSTHAMHLIDYAHSDLSKATTALNTAIDMRDILDVSAKSLQQTIKAEQHKLNNYKPAVGELDVHDILEADLKKKVAELNKLISDHTKAKASVVERTDTRQHALHELDKAYHDHKVLEQRRQEAKHAPRQHAWEKLRKH